MLGKKQCTSCRKYRQAYSFYQVKMNKNLCHWCHQSYMKGKKLIGTKWLGKRKSKKEIDICQKSWYFKNVTQKVNHFPNLIRTKVTSERETFSTAQVRRLENFFLED